MDIVERLKTIRGTMTQAEFANQLGIHKNTLGRYERGESNPDIVFCAKVCSIFGISPRWLIMGIGDMREDSVTGVATCQQTKDSVMYSSCKNKHCYRCEQLENRLEKVAMQRDELMEENRQLYRDKLHLVEENGNLKELVARMEEREKKPSASAVYSEKGGAA